VSGVLGGLVVVVATIGCGEAPRRDCATWVWAQPLRAGARLEVIGSWDGWLTPGILLQATEEPGWWAARVDGEVPPGEHGYLILEDGVDRLDEHNPLTTFWAEQGDLEVSLLQVPDCGLPVLTVTEVKVAEDAVRVQASFVAGTDGAAGMKRGGDAGDGGDRRGVGGRGGGAADPRARETLSDADGDGRGGTGRGRGRRRSCGRRRRRGRTGCCIRW
jgi:hypothetical protein